TSGSLRVFQMRFTLALLILSSFALFSCDAEIGDSCSVNVDCSTSGDRVCDRSQPGGYCTVEGCSASSCPSGSRCVAFFPTAALMVTCDPLTEDVLDESVRTDDCTMDEVCLKSGYCAPHYLQRTYCMKKCSSGGDCRGKYECRETGTLGTQRLPGDGESYGTVSDVKICISGTYDEVDVVD
ncbi:hypothetical protein KJ865_11985, partial [Myxococcota bacterium]|nr:hypothetical protein [Myxococcota bacterium]